MRDDPCGTPFLLSIEELRYRELLTELRQSTAELWEQLERLDSLKLVLGGFKEGFTATNFQTLVLTLGELTELLSSNDHKCKALSDKLEELKERLCEQDF